MGEEIPLNFYSQESPASTWDEPGEIEIKVPLRTTTARARIVFEDVADTFVSNTLEVLRSMPPSKEGFYRLGITTTTPEPSTSFSNLDLERSTTTSTTSTTQSPLTSFVEKFVTPEPTPSNRDLVISETMPDLVVSPTSTARPITTQSTEWVVSKKDVSRELQYGNQKDPSIVESFEMVLIIVGASVVILFFLDKALKGIYRASYQRTMFSLLTGKFCLLGSLFMFYEIKLIFKAEIIFF